MWKICWWVFVGGGFGFAGTRVGQFSRRLGEWFVRMAMEDCMFVQVVEFGVVRSPCGSFLQQAECVCEERQLWSTRMSLEGRPRSRLCLMIMTCRLLAPHTNNGAANNSGKTGSALHSFLPGSCCQSERKVLLMCSCTERTHPGWKISCRSSIR